MGHRMGKYGTQLQLITGRQAVDTYRRQQQFEDEQTVIDNLPCEIIDYVPADEAQTKAQVVYTQTNHYHHYPTAPPLSQSEKPPATTDDFAVWMFFYASVMSIFLLGFLFANALR